MSSTSQVPIHGNYHGYYVKRPSVNGGDSRLALLPRDLFKGKRVLDVGCNEGWVTCEIGQSWGAHRVVGVDIDESLVSAAWRRRRTAWSLQEPDDKLELGDASLEGSSDNVTSRPRKRRRSGGETAEETAMKSMQSYPQPMAAYFPMSCEHEFGALPVPPSEKRGKHTFPHNVTFVTADWVNEPIPDDTEGYDVVIGFSLTKWIHLNGGDRALKAFFKRVHDVLRPGGIFVLEAQAWDTYVKARKMDKALQETYSTLQFRPEQFEAILFGIGFGPKEHQGTAGEGGFCRDVDLYRKLE